MEPYKKNHNHYIKVIINNIIRDENDCWVWQRALNTNGYGQSCYNGKQINVHQMAKIVFNEYIEGLSCDHLCKNKQCCNPDHIEMVTIRENVLRSDNPAAKNLRKTHCKYGHPFSGDNLKLYKSGGKIVRKCHACLRAKSARYRAKRKKITS